MKEGINVSQPNENSVMIEAVGLSKRYECLTLTYHCLRLTSYVKHPKRTLSLTSLPSVGRNGPIEPQAAVWRWKSAGKPS